MAVKEEFPATTSSGTTNVVTLGSAPEGHGLVAIIGAQGALDPSISGSGWTEIQNTQNGLNVRLKSWRKVAGASEPTSITFTFSGSIDAIGCVYRFSGIDTADFMENSAGGATGSDESAECGTAGGGTADFKLCYVAWRGVTSPSDLSDGYLQDVEETVGSLVLWTATDMADGSSESPVFVADTTGDWVANNISMNGLSVGGAHHLMRMLGAR